MDKQLAHTRIHRALKQNTPSTNAHVYQSGDEVLVEREKLIENRIGEWTGPYIVKSYEGNSRIVLVQKSDDSPYERYNITQVKPFLRPQRSRPPLLGYGTYHPFGLRQATSTIQGSYDRSHRQI